MNLSPAGLAGSRMQRVAARGRLSARLVWRSTRLCRISHECPAKIRLPVRDDDALEAVLINTAGGLTGGDRIAWTIEAEAGAGVVVTTQACEKVYRSSGGRAEATCTLRAGAGARIAWLPQETIVFDRSAFARRLYVEPAEEAEALLLEATLFGRRAMGETVGFAAFRDRWRVRVDGRLVHAEDFAVGPDVAAALSWPAVTGGAVAVATVLLVARDAADRLDAARAIVGGDGGGASAWQVGGTGKLLARLVAADGYALRRRLVALVGLLNGHAGLPKVWSL